MAKNGFARSKALCFGKYTVVEITAPEGMMINLKAHIAMPIKRAMFLKSQQILFEGGY